MSNESVVFELGISVGDVLRIDYMQPMSGGSQRVGRVVNIQDTHKEPIDRYNSYYYRRWDKNFLRSRHLVTMVDTHGHFRKFYIERSNQVIKLSLLSRFRFAVASWINCRLPNYYKLPASGHE